MVGRRVRVPAREVTDYTRAVSCPSCLADVPAGARFCPACGSSLATRADERRVISVLFGDIVGFTALSETMNPDAMAKLLTEYFTEMVDIIFSHGGTLDKSN